MNIVNVIVGPTSSGKTSLALDLCQKHNGVIISADSRQIFKYMDIGTGKLPLNVSVKINKADKVWNINGIDIWGYDLATPDVYFSAHDYAQFAISKAKELMVEGKMVFVVGGTGFYIDVITNRINLTGAEPNFELRNILETVPTPNLQSWLTSLNQNKFENIDVNNRARLIRAIEIELSEKNSYATPLPLLENGIFNFIGITGTRDFLYSKVDSWVDSIWENGIVEETQELLNAGFADSRPMHGLIYKSVVSVINGQTTEIAAIERIKFDLHAYIRRQQTWFKKNNQIKWLDAQDTNLSQIASNLVS